MKRIKAMNQFYIYEASEKDSKKYNVDAGCFYIYFKEDIKNYGIALSDYEMEAGSVQEAIDFIRSY